MKKICLFMIACCIFMLAARPKSVPKTVQGIPYSSTLPEQQRKAVLTSDYPENPDDLVTPEGNFTFDMIQSWTGEGENRAALVIQWNDDNEKNALVFGYRWDGQATGADMFRAVVAANPQLYGLIQYTNVSSPTDPNGGYTINGIGWDSDDDGDIALIDTGKGNQVYESENGLFIHPRGYVPGQGGSSDYDYDNWIARDADDFWGAGWYQSYWSYWVKDSQNANFGYSSWGASGRVLKDGSWDGWNFSLDMIPRDWKNFAAAPNPMPAGTKTEFTVGNLCYKLVNYSKKTVEVCAPYTGVAVYSGSVTIPSTFTDEGTVYTVVAIGNRAFADSKVTEVTMPLSVTKIGKEAFASSTLSNLKVSNASDFNHIQSMGEAAFKNCRSLTSPIWSQKITVVPASLYEGTSVSTLSIPEYIEKLSERSFADCRSLTTVTIPSSLKEIGNECFAQCDAITKVKSYQTTPLPITAATFSQAAYQNATLEIPTGFDSAYKSATGWSGFTKIANFKLPVKVGDMFVYNKVNYVVTGLSDNANTVKATYSKVDGTPDRNKIKAANQANYVGDLVIPETVPYQEQTFRVTQLNDSAFYEANKLTGITLPEGISRIGDYTFYDCTTLTSCNIPSTVKSIGTYAFGYTKLVEITLPDNFEQLGDRCFQACSTLKSINIPSKVTEIPQYAFYGTGFETFTIGENITSMKNNIFQSCKNLTSVIINAQIKELPAYCFSSCTKLANVTYPQTIETIGVSCFEGCKLLNPIIPTSVKSIGGAAFSGSGITVATLPQSMTEVPMSLFYNCKSLKAVYLPKGITAIKSQAFRGCSALTSVISTDEMRNASSENDEDGIISFPASLKTIDSYAFAECSSIKGLRLNEGLEGIGDRVFSKLTAVTDLKLPSTVTRIGSNAFEELKITSLTLPASISYLGGYICSNCPDKTVRKLPIYICADKPFEIGSSTFCNGNYSTYNPLIVPTGCADTFKKTSLYYGAWNKYTFSAPVIKGMTIGSPVVTLDNVRIPVTFSYDMTDLPEDFAIANADHILRNAKITLTYGEKGASDKSTTDLTAAGNAMAEAGITLKPGVEYTGKLTVTTAEGETFTTGDFDMTGDIPVAPEAIRTWIGEGNDSAILTMRFNDGKGIENIRFGVRFNAPASLESVMESIVRADRRIYALKDRDSLIGYGFDLNGDGLIGLNADGNALSGENGIFSGATSGVTPLQEYDHWALNDASASWKTFRAPFYKDNYTVLTGDIEAYDSIVLEFTAADTPTTPEYLVYLDNADVIGAWLPEGMSMPIADEAFMPLLINVGEEGKLSSVSWKYTDENGQTDNSRISKITVTDPSKGNTVGKVTFGLHTGNVVLSAKPNISNVTTSYSAPATVAVNAPEIPVTSISFEEEVIESKLNCAFELKPVLTPENATFTQIEFTSSDNSVARVDKTKGSVNVYQKEGTATITAKYTYNPEVSANVTVNAALRVPVEKIVLGDGSDRIKMTYLDILGINPAIEPADADIQTYDIEISDPEIATIYPVNVGASYPFTKLNELVTHKTGTFTLTLSAKDGSGTKSVVTVDVVDGDRKPLADEYQDGIFWLNEDWFGHTNGSINYIDHKDNIRYRVYESQNPGESFGCTSQFATIGADKLVVMSKQADDKGDPRQGGGRVVVADAKTLKKLASFNDIDDPKSDGRACVYAGYDKFYIGSTAAIRVLDANTLELGNLVEGIAGGSQYSAQLGEMVRAGEYVFVIQQDKGVYAIDTRNDKVVKTFGFETNTDEEGKVTTSVSWYPQGIATTPDGMVWIAAFSQKGNKEPKFHCIDSETLEVVKSIDVPAHLAVTCSWGSWRKANFFGCKKSNEIVFGAGVESSIVSGNTAYYIWDTYSSLDNIEPVFVMPDNLPGAVEGLTQAPYASVGYDEHSDRLMIATTHGPSGNYRYEWLHFVDCRTGKISKTIEMKPYYWFPAMPVFPDKYGADLFYLEYIHTDMNSEAVEIDLSKYILDADDIDRNIRISLNEDNGQLAGIADIQLKGKMMTVTPKQDAKGKASINFTAESNGKYSSISIPLYVGVETGVEGFDRIGKVYAEDNSIVVEGMDGTSFRIYDLGGKLAGAFTAAGDYCRFMTGLPTGVYIVISEDGKCNLKTYIR